VLLHSTFYSLKNQSRKRCNVPERSRGVAAFGYGLGLPTQLQMTEAGGPAFKPTRVEQNEGAEALGMLILRTRSAVWGVELSHTAVSAIIPLFRMPFSGKLLVILPID
jgi:hypothetical protein